MTTSPFAAPGGPGINPDQVVLVVPSAARPGRYTVFTLVETDLSSPHHPASPLIRPPFQLEQCDTADPPPGLLGSTLVRRPPPHLTCELIDVVVSTGSGAGHALAFWDEVLQPLLEAIESIAARPVSDPADRGAGSGLQDRAGGVPIARCHRVLVTKDANSVREFARHLHRERSDEAGEGQQRTVILLSGDGGVADLLNGCGGGGDPPTAAAQAAATTSTSTTLALLPLGTANALFHSLHKPAYAAEPAASPLVLGLRTLLRGRASALPVFRAAFSPAARLVGRAGGVDRAAVRSLTGAIVVSYGFHASLVHESDTDEYRRFGSARFGMVAAKLADEGHAYRARVELDGRPVRDGKDEGGKVAAAAAERHGYVLAAMVSNLERTFTISPAGRPLDGRLRLLRFGAVPGSRTMEIMMAAYRDGEHVQMPDVQYSEVRDELAITVLGDDARWRTACVDDYMVELEPGGRMTVRRAGTGPFRILVHEAVLVGGGEVSAD